MNKAHPMHALITANLSRNDQIVICYRANNTQQEIADAFGISRARVQQVLKRRGITKADSTRTPRGQLFKMIAAHVHKSVKKRFKQEADKRGLSESSYSAQLIMSELARIKKSETSA